MTRMNTQKVARIFTITLSGVLVVVLAAATAAPALGQAHGTFTFTGSMHFARAFHTATLLQNGQVLVAGGLCGRGECSSTFATVLAEAELYNPSTGTWTVTGSMSTPRYNHTATLLKNGQVLVAGGQNDSGILSSAELYNPSTGKWSTTGSMTVARESHGAVLLQDGEVLVAGGGSATNTAELYDPTTGTFMATGSMNYGRNSQLTLLQNGEAFIAAGTEGFGDCTGELFSNGEWRLTSVIPDCGFPGNTAALLPNGDVVLGDVVIPQELYDPSTNVWQATQGGAKVPFNTSASAPLALLATGNVLSAGCGVVGGAPACSQADLYDPSTNEWTPTGSLNRSRGGFTLTRLLNGQVLAAGGQYQNAPNNSGVTGGVRYTATAELYTP
jgi:hypothetical protein